MARGTNLSALQQELSPRVADKLTASAGDKAVSGQRSWTFGTVVRETTVGKGVIGHPALVDEGEGVGLRVFDSAAKATRSHALGVRRLLTLTNPSPVRWVVAHLGRTEKLALADSAYPTVPDLLADAWLKAGEQLACESGPLDGVRTEADYQRVALAVRQECPGRTLQVVNTAAQALVSITEAKLLLAGMPADDPVRTDVATQLGNLFFNRFISATPEPWFQHLPRYAQAAVVRLRAAAVNPSRDDKVAGELYDIEDTYAELTDAQPPGPLPPAVEEIAFLIEEFRVSLFAQQLRTAVPISAKRIRQAIRQAV